MDESLAAFLPKPESSHKSFAWQGYQSVRLPAPKVDSLSTSLERADSENPPSRSFASRQVEFVAASWSPNPVNRHWSYSAASLGDRIGASSTSHEPWPRAICHLAEAASDELEQLRAEERSLRCLWQTWYVKDMIGGRVASSEGSVANGASSSGSLQIARFADQAKVAEQELAHLYKQAQQEESQHHRAAEEWRQAYREAKDALKRKQVEVEASEARIGELQAEVSSLRSALRSASADLEDASAAYRATNARVTSEQATLSDELAKAKLAAEGARREKAEAEQQHQDELRKELLECLQQEATEKALLHRLQKLRSDAETQWAADKKQQDEVLAPEPQKVDAACQIGSCGEEAPSKSSSSSQTSRQDLAPPDSVGQAERRTGAEPDLHSKEECITFDQRQWLLSRVQKLHAVKDQLLSLRQRSLSTLNGKRRQKILSGQGLCASAGGRNVGRVGYETSSI